MIKRTMEIDAILLSLNKAIDAHYQWLVDTLHSVITRDTSKSEITDNRSYGLCQFGRWINHLGPLDNNELPYVRLMDSAYQHMRNCGRELVLAIVENHWRGTHFNALQKRLFSFITALADYKIYLLTVRNNMDVLTGLSGRQVPDESFDHQLHDAKPLDLYLMLLDTNWLKLVNNTYGHLIGDVVLRTLTTCLASWTHDYETVYRYGGEESIIIVKATNGEEACRAGVRIYRLADDHAIIHSEGHISITVTTGVGHTPPEEPLDVVIERTDRATYEGKQTGRSRCMFIDEQNVVNRV